MGGGPTCSSRKGTTQPLLYSNSTEKSQMTHRFSAAITGRTAVFFIWVRAPGPAAGQAFYPKDTPKFPQAKTWLERKAKLPPYATPRTPDGVPDLQGVWGGPIGGGNDDLEDHEYV